MLDQVVKLAQEQDTFAAIAQIETKGEPTEVAKAYADLVPALYYKRKDVPLMLAIGRAGVHYCLSESQRVGDRDAELATKLRGVAKMLAFNLAVNCWPAWEDDGIALTRSEIAVGRDLARLNLRLAMELDRDADKLAGAWWLLGAHQVSAQETDEAIGSFDKAENLYGQAKQDEGRWMAKGYAAVAKRTVASSADEGKQELNAAIAELRKLDTDDARFYADQLEAVDKFFTK